MKRNSCKNYTFLKKCITNSEQQVIYETPGTTGCPRKHDIFKANRMSSFS